MTVMEAIQIRRSVRRYHDKPVESEKLAQVLEAARLAPSARNLQEWRFVVVQDADIRRQLMHAAKGQQFVQEAPVVIACCAETNNNYTMSCGQLAYPIDVAIAIDHITLAAVELGLGTCWIGAFWEDDVKRILNIPEEIRVVELLTLGYPVDEPHKKHRRPLFEIVMYERWEDFQSDSSHGFAHQLRKKFLHHRKSQTT